MKKIISLILVALIGHIIPLRAAPVDRPEVLPIQSVRQLRIYALGQVSWVQSQAWAPTSYNPVGDYIDVEVFDGDINTALVKAASHGFSLFLANLNDPVDLHCSLYGSDGFQYFWAASQSHIDGGRFHGELKLQMSAHIPIFVGVGLEYARVIERDEFGNVVAMDYLQTFGDSEKGWLWFPAYYAGISGEILLGYKDGSTVAYDIRSGGAISFTYVGGNSEIGVRGTTFYRNPESINILVDSKDFGLGVGTLAQVINDTSGNITIKVRAQLPDGELFSGVIVRTNAFGPIFGTAKRQGDSGTVQVKVPKGTSWIEFTYPSGFGDKEFRQPQVPPVGKG